MGLFDNQHLKIVRFLENTATLAVVHDGSKAASPWPTDARRNMVMAGDTAVELGNPGDASVSFLYWVEEPGSLTNGRITVIGPDIPESAGSRLPFGKVAIIGATGFDAENSLHRYRELESVRYALHLKGYMMRAASGYGREWSRVSREAHQGGFSFAILGKALVDSYLELDYVHSVELIFVTGTHERVLWLSQTAGEVDAIVGAMHKIMEESLFDCETCDYSVICEETAGLRSMHRAWGGK